MGQAAAADLPADGFRMAIEFALTLRALFKAAFCRLASAGNRFSGLSVATVSHQRSARWVSCRTASAISAG